jgi:hypothetical protein
MEFLIYIVIAVVASWIGWHARGIVFLSNISNHPEKMIKMLEQIKKINEEELDDMPESLGTEIRAELVGSTWYIYTKADGEFLAQGPSFDDAISAVADRFPNKKFWCSKSEQSSQTA